MRRDVVSWRIAGAVVGVLLLALVAIGVLRADGFSAVDASSPYSTRWFTDPASQRLVLIDGYSGRALARIEPGEETQITSIAQGGGQAALIDRANRSVRTIDNIALKLGPSQPLPIVADPSSVFGMSANGLVVVDPIADEAQVVPPGGAPVNVDVVADPSPSRVLIAPNGGIWTLVDGGLHRTTANETETVATGLEVASLTLVGDSPFVVDGATGRAQLGTDGWVDLPDGLQLGDLALQAPGPREDCGWIGVDDRLLCVGTDVIHHDITFEGLDIDGGDLVAVSGDAAAIVDRSDGTITRLDWRNAKVVETVATAGTVSTNLRAAVGSDLLWIDSPIEPTVWVVNPWGLVTVQKDDASTPILGDEGKVLKSGEPGQGEVVSGGTATDAEERQPDRNGVDDPPVAVDDAVTARSGNLVAINVTANDYDPDGEAISVSTVTTPGSGTAVVSSATTVSYQPSPGYSGPDEFSYTIVDGNGTEASATVSIELVSPDGPNQAPVGNPDIAQTGPDRPVIVDVLLNDVDPERDALRISAFQSDVAAGEVEEVTTASGIPGLRFSPADGFSGQARFSYTPMDSIGAVGEPVDVVVEVAPPGTENRPPVAKPDAIRLRRNQSTELPVLANDVDPDGDELTLESVTPLPDGIEAEVDGRNLVITARAGAATLSPMSYSVSDSRGLEALGAILVYVVDDDEPNQPPVANADAVTAVAGKTTVIDVLQNDTDPDGDPLAIVSAVESGDGGSVAVDGDELIYTAPELVGEEPLLDRFYYVIVDTQGNNAEGIVSVKVIPEELPEPPVALDDSVNTERDLPVTIDVLDNDTDPSGQALSIAGKPGCPSGGRAEVTSDQRVRYTPPRGAAGVFNCSYEIANASGLRASATITISVVNPSLANKPPLVTGEDRAVRAGESITVDVLANDSDPDGDDSKLRLVSSTRPASGTASRDGRAGTITFQAPGVATVVSVSYDVQDEAGGIASGRLVLRVIETPEEDEAEKQPPVARPDERTVQSPIAEVFIDVLANDNDPDGDRATLKLLSAKVISGSGSASVVNQQVRVEPQAAYTGSLVVEYQIQDSDELNATGRIVLTVLPPIENRPPKLESIDVSVAAGETVEVSLSRAASDPDGDDLSFSIAAKPDSRKGVATLAGTVLTFDSNVTAQGTATVLVNVSDGQNVVSGEVRITIIACGEAPPEADNATIEIGYRQTVEIDLYEYVKSGVIGRVSGVIDRPKASYTPPPNENGNVEVNFDVENACGGLITRTLTIDVNQDPVAGDITVSAGRGQQTDIPVSDLARDNEELAIVKLDGAPSWARIAADGQTIVLTPGELAGRVQFDAVVSDPGGLQARSTITVSFRNEPPVAVDDLIVANNVKLEFNPLKNDRDPDGDTIKILGASNVATFENVSVPVLVGPDKVEIDLSTAEGRGTMSYQIIDDAGNVSSTAQIIIETDWTAPTASDMSVSVLPNEYTRIDMDVADADGQRVTVELIDPVPDGWTIEPVRTQLRIIAPAVEATTLFTIPYRVVDSGGRSDEAELTVEVIATTTSTTGDPS